MRRIVITGAESTGKSTLAKVLAKHFSAPLSTEFVRQYVNAVQRPLTAEDLEPIARGQFAAEAAAISNANNLVLHDTNILSSILYAKHYFDVTLDWVDQKLQPWIDRLKAGRQPWGTAARRRAESTGSKNNDKMQMSKQQK